MELTRRQEANCRLVRWLIERGDFSEECDLTESEAGWSLPVTKREYTATYYEGLTPKTRLTTDSDEVLRGFVENYINHPMVISRSQRNGNLYETWADGTGDCSFVLVQSPCQR